MMLKFTFHRAILFGFLWLISSQGRPDVTELESPTTFPTMPVRPSRSTTPPTGTLISHPSSQPSETTSQPSRKSTSQPSSEPTSRSSSQPSNQPTRQPSGQSSNQPSTQPSQQPSSHPTSGQPSSKPNDQPSSVPSVQPSSLPSVQPTYVPTAQPSGIPSTQPSSSQSSDPTSQSSASLSSSQPSTQPSTLQPSELPTSQPSVQPSSEPSGQSSQQPSSAPTSEPSSQPSTNPTAVPSSRPTAQPSSLPSAQPSNQPSVPPTSVPSVVPTQPFSQPSSAPSPKPSPVPTVIPTHAPSAFDASAPLVYITTTAQARTAVNVAQKTSFTGIVTAKTSCVAEWSVKRADVYLAVSTLTPLYTSIAAANAAKAVNLVLAPFTLPVRSTLLFVLTCGESASATVVTTNGPPIVGLFTALPASGLELSTQFSLAAKRWMDADLPITFQFGFLAPTSGAFLVMQSRSLVNATAAVLPAGAFSVKYRLQCVVQAYDVLGASSNGSAIVTVAKQTNAAQMQGSILSLLSSSSGDVAATKSAIAVGAAALNSVCVYDVGHLGTSCNATSSTHSAKKNAIEQLLSGLSRVASMEPASSESVPSWADILAELTQDPFELSNDAVAAVYALSLSIVTSAQSVSEGVAYATLSGVLASLNAGATAIVSTASSNTPAIANAVLHVVSQFADLVTSQLVVGEAAVELIYDNFRSVCVRLLATPGSPVKLSVPQTSAELASAGAMSSVSIDLGTASDVEVTVSFSSTVASIHGVQGETFISNPLSLQLRVSSTAVTRVTAVIVNNEAVEYTDDAAATMSFNSSCSGDTDRSVHHYTCPLSGHVLSHNCSGLSGVMSSFCPVLVPSCNIKDSSGVFAPNSSVCTVRTFDELSTTCECVLSGHRLADSLDEPVVLDLVTATIFLANSFASTFHASGELTSTAALKRVLIVIILFSTLWAGGMSLIICCGCRRKAMEKFNDKERSKLQSKLQNAQVSRSPAAACQNIVDYVNEMMPAIFSDKILIFRIFGEIKSNHGYLKLFLAPAGKAGDTERLITAVRILCAQTTQLFLLALLYDVQGPSDDGTCQYKLSQTECTRRHSPFDNSQSYCGWVDSSTSNSFSCTYKDPHFTLQVAIYVGVTVALFGALVVYPMNRLLELLGAPEADDPGLLQRATGRAFNVARRVSLVATIRKFFAGNVVRIIPQSVQDAHAMAAASLLSRSESSGKFGAFAGRDVESGSNADSQSGSSNSGEFGASAGRDVESSSNADSRSGSSDESEEVLGVGTDNAGPAGQLPESETDNSRVNAIVEETFNKLEGEIRSQRPSLPSAERDEYDFKWGLDPNGAFARSTEDRIKTELRLAITESTKSFKKLRNATDQQIGLEILLLFVIDLLGRNTYAARIFRGKFEEDYQHTNVVSKFTKRLAALVLVALNIFFVYYAMLTSYQRGEYWQQVLIYAWVTQIVVDIFLFETMECIWVHCAVPHVVRAEVRQVVESILVVVKELCAGNTAPTDPRYFVNAHEFLFISTNLAQKFPTMMESILVRNYCSHLPGELAKTWQVGSIAHIQRSHLPPHIWWLSLFSVTSVLQYLGTAPFIFHRMFVRTAQPFALFAFLLLWQLIIQDPVFIGIAVGVTVIFCAVGVYLCRANGTFSSKVMAEITDAENSVAPNTALKNASDSTNLTEIFEESRVHEHSFIASPDSEAQQNEVFEYSVLSASSGGSGSSFNSFSDDDSAV